MQTETETFLQWHRKETDRGLVDVKFFVGDTSNATQEEFFRELNAINGLLDQGKAVPRADVF